MTIQQMQYYIKVCQYKSFTKAARDLSVSQPGISSAMRELERECGVELFEVSISPMRESFFWRR